MPGIRRIPPPREKDPGHQRKLQLIALRRVIALAGPPGAGEIGQLRQRPSRVEHDVLILDVAVDAAGPVHLAERPCDLLDPPRVRGAVAPSALVVLSLAVVLEQCGTEPFHGDHPPVTNRAGELRRYHRREVRPPQRQLRLPPDASQRHRRTDAGPIDLQHQLSPLASLRKPDFRALGIHPTWSDRMQQTVGAESGPGGQ